MGKGGGDRQPYRKREQKQKVREIRATVSAKIFGQYSFHLFHRNPFTEDAPAPQA